MTSSWTVLEEVSYKKRIHYRVRCSCGYEGLRRRDFVDSGYSKMCSSCSSKLTAKTSPPPINRTGCEGLSGSHFSSIKHGAKVRGISFNLTPEFLWELYVKQRGKCALTGVDIQLSNDVKNQNVNWDIVTASLDRIDNSKGYDPDNVWWVHKVANRLKNNYTVKELVYWSRLIVETYDGVRNEN